MGPAHWSGPFPQLTAAWPLNGHPDAIESDQESLNLDFGGLFAASRLAANGDVSTVLQTAVNSGLRLLDHTLGSSFVIGLDLRFAAPHMDDQVQVVFDPFEGLGLDCSQRHFLYLLWPAGAWDASPPMPTLYFNNQQLQPDAGVQPLFVVSQTSIELSLVLSLDASDGFSVFYLGTDSDGKPTPARMTAPADGLLQQIMSGQYSQNGDVFTQSLAWMRTQDGASCPEVDSTGEAVSITAYVPAITSLYQMPFVTTITNLDKVSSDFHLTDLSFELPVVATSPALSSFNTLLDAQALVGNVNLQQLTSGVASVVANIQAKLIPSVTLSSTSIAGLTLSTAALQIKGTLSTWTVTAYTRINVDLTQAQFFGIPFKLFGGFDDSIPRPGQRLRPSGRSLQRPVLPQRSDPAQPHAQRPSAGQCGAAQRLDADGRHSRCQ